MTDSTTDTQSADAGFDVGSSVDDLFGEIESDGDPGGDQRAETDDGDGSDAVEDRTAADVFDQLRTDAGDESGADDILADESPDDIIASADEPGPEPDATVDDDLLADDDELADLLLTGRTKEQEFLWIETDGSDETGEPSEPDESSEADVETETDSEPPTGDADPSGGVDEPAAPDELVERLFGDSPESDFDPDEATATDAGTESDSPSNSSIAVSDRDRGTDSSVETDADEPAAEEAESDSASERPDDTEAADDSAADDADATDGSVATDDSSSGFFGRLLSIIGGLF
ncbi:hypothetical protein [Natrinema soli]|uniref:ATPase AAA n=1 Tax=Natrinema soli TaxID=1930624 RepID=A0ABD5SQB8_9EURY|nr:hypothetical protein [Natrinema soli]